MRQQIPSTFVSTFLSACFLLACSAGENDTGGGPVIGADASTNSGETDAGGLAARTGEYAKYTRNKSASNMSL